MNSNHDGKGKFSSGSGGAGKDPPGFYRTGSHASSGPEKGDMSAKDWKGSQRLKAAEMKMEKKYNAFKKTHSGSEQRVYDQFRNTPAWKEYQKVADPGGKYAKQAAAFGKK
jgi:hypothetical protein